VTDFARALTGWSIGNERGRRHSGTPGQYHFRSEIHEPGSVSIMGKRYKQKGIAQGEAILSDLSTHPATARHLAEKLARHFVADDPPAGLVDSLAKTFLESGGDLPALHTVLVKAADPWQTPFAKYKTPEDFVISTFRAFRYEPTNIRTVITALESMGQAPYRPGSPAGWPDTAAHWGGADGLYKRIEWSNAIARNMRSRVNPVELAEQVHALRRVREQTGKLAAMRLLHHQDDARFIHGIERHSTGTMLAQVESRLPSQRHAVGRGARTHDTEGSCGLHLDVLAVPLTQ